MVAIPMTENNRNLADAVNKRINADRVMVSARASLWRLGGVALIILSIGGAVGLAEYGYASLNNDQALADRMALSFAKALEQVKIPPITGTVEMTPGTVAMPEPGEVVMKKPGVVEIKPGGTVEVRGGVSERPGTSPVNPVNNNITIQPGGTVGPTSSIGPTDRPTTQQLTGTNPPANQAKTVTNFTIFKFVKYGTGHVATGWDFSSNEQTAPSSQFCYYDPNPTADVSETQYLVRNNGKYTASAYIDGGAALAQCQWFNGQAPTPTSSEVVPAPTPVPEINKTAYRINACGEERGFSINWMDLPANKKDFYGAWSGHWNTGNSTCGGLVITQITVENSVVADYYYKKPGDQVRYKSVKGTFRGDNTISLKDDENSTFEFTRVGDTMTVQFSGKSGQTHATFNRIPMTRS